MNEPSDLAKYRQALRQAQYKLSERELTCPELVEGYKSIESASTGSVNVPFQDGTFIPLDAFGERKTHPNPE